MGVSPVPKTNNFFSRLVSSVVMFAIALPILFQGTFFVFGLVSVVWVGLLVELWWTARLLSAKKMLILLTCGTLVLVYTFLFMLQLRYVFTRASVVPFLFFFLPAVWATDSFAYFMGRLIQGPKMAPRISPNKTWSGTFCGILAGSTWGCGYLLYFNALTAWGAFIALSIPVVVVLGDLAESWVKRAAGIKDSSALIPGHGGLWDRFDGVVAVMLLFFGLSMFLPETFVAFLKTFTTF